ncbi:hypothetical protein [Dyella tabacisoli]|uniref:Uncharacterized protein n=1 Tax=Dyella tabacisoli TaxID=2282381 RepID=A0A369UL60_9GAMM|nr:hypothetical protein [Dyella tabacisoli]RDD81261.1 hypothetical protein DVJ77_13175 [Dyella tabacisoli]
MTSEQPAVTVNTSPKRIDSTFRNGSVTAVSVMLAFSLGYLSRWSANPVPWISTDTIALLPMVLGILLQCLTLGRLLMPECLLLANYRVSMRIFLAGFILVAVGVVIAVTLDAKFLGIHH